MARIDPNIADLEETLKAAVLEKSKYERKLAIETKPKQKPLEEFMTIAEAGGKQESAKEKEPLDENTRQIYTQRVRTLDNQIKTLRTRITKLRKEAEQETEIKRPPPLKGKTAPPERIRNLGTIDRQSEDVELYHTIVDKILDVAYLDNLTEDPIISGKEIYYISKYGKKIIREFEDDCQYDWLNVLTKAEKQKFVLLGFAQKAKISEALRTFIRNMVYNIPDILLDDFLRNVKKNKQLGYTEQYKLWTEAPWSMNDELTNAQAIHSVKHTEEEVFITQVGGNYKKSFFDKRKEIYETEILSRIFVFMEKIQQELKEDNSIRTAIDRKKSSIMRQDNSLTINQRFNLLVDCCCPTSSVIVKRLCRTIVSFFIFYPFIESLYLFENDFPSIDFDREYTILIDKEYDLLLSLQNITLFDKINNATLPELVEYANENEIKIEDNLNIVIETFKKNYSGGITEFETNPLFNTFLELFKDTLEKDSHNLIYLRLLILSTIKKQTQVVPTRKKREFTEVILTEDIPYTAKTISFLTEIPASEYTRLQKAVKQMPTVIKRTKEPIQFAMVSADNILPDVKEQLVKEIGGRKNQKN